MSRKVINGVDKGAGGLKKRVRFGCVFGWQLSVLRYVN